MQLLDVHTIRGHHMLVAIKGGICVWSQVSPEHVGMRETPLRVILALEGARLEEGKPQ
jgi:hypothetical protein